ncbi:hypothetical protein RhiirA4_479846 [Rhizophagus irregularis]|uniref:Uncharacterized protein n=1 Tax=Rhizophagus irregularis TaxID=588596 RepID=A0A2I1HH02_9GLOM|nr:hypothetical protein RhiirA4_479846 [Rhizophagus irregularis]
MELANNYIGNSLDSKSNPDLIQFIPFNNGENKCFYCKRFYSTTPLFYQQYCEYCLMLYIKYTNNNNLDVSIGTIYSQCRKHEPRSLDFCTKNIKEWCNNCSEILCFKQIVTNNRWGYIPFRYKKNKYIEKIKNCGLCGKSYQPEHLNELDYDFYVEFKLCSDWYQTSFEWIESTLTKKVIPILYLPWWDTYNQCTACGQFLEFKSNCQKLCSNCKIIYTGCRYCLTTNIIFGITNQSQCKKCKRIISITIDITNDIEEESFISTKINTYNTYNYNQISDYTNRKNSNQLEIYNYISRFYFPLKSSIDLILYSQITNFENMKDSSNPIIPIIFIPFNNDENKCCYCRTDVIVAKFAWNFSGKLRIIPQECLDELSYIEFKLCLNCYKISSGWIESAITKRTIPILYLPWWDTYNQCTACGQFLEFKSNCQKLCSNCKIIYTGCRYCLTTNIIFGITDKSQCKKCKRIISIIIDITNDIEDESFVSTKISAYNYSQITNYTNNKNSNPLEVYNLISRLYLPLKPLIDLVIYFQIANLQNIDDYSNPIIPTMFIPFNNDENECYYCKRSYFTTLLFEQKYCKHCLMSYIKYTNNNNLDVHITTIDSQCSNRHKPRSLDFYIQNIQEWCNKCSEISYFKQ